MTELLKNKIAVVTGSSSGIGRSIAIALARSGAHIMLHGRAPSEQIESVTAEIRDLGVEANSIFGDFSKFTHPDSWTEFVERAWGWKSGVDVWVNNAGGDVLTGTWADASLEKKLDYLVQVDVKATLLLSREIAMRMTEHNRSKSNQPTSIINIGWDQANQGMAGESGELFAATKGAIMAMSKSLAQSFAPHVRVNCVAPGWIKTQWGHQASEAWNQRAVDEALMNRWGRPEDIAAAVAFLASPEASFISGQVLPVNGGFQFYKSR